MLAEFANVYLGQTGDCFNIGILAAGRTTQLQKEIVLMLKHISTPVDGPCKKVQGDSVGAIFQKDLDEACEQIVYRRKNLFLKKKGITTIRKFSRRLFNFKFSP